MRLFRLDHLGNGRNILRYFFLVIVKGFRTRRICFEITGCPVFDFQFRCDFFLDFHILGKRFRRTGIFFGRHALCCQQVGCFFEIGRVFGLLFRQLHQPGQNLVVLHKVFNLMLVRKIGIDILQHLLVGGFGDLFFAFRRHLAFGRYFHALRFDQQLDGRLHLIERDVQILGRDVIVHLQKIFDVTGYFHNSTYLYL